jgi:hypothetical protein
MIKHSITRAVMLLAALGAILAVTVPASASPRVDNRTIRIG